MLKPEDLIGKHVRIVEIRMFGEPLGEDQLTPGITFDTEEGHRVTLEALRWDTALRITEARPG